MARFHCRCRRCDARQVLARHPDDYVRERKCKVCRKGTVRVDRWMMRRNTRAMGCDCGGYPFFHRKASYYCHYRADGTKRLFGDPDFTDRYEPHPKYMATSDVD